MTPEAENHGLSLRAQHVPGNRARIVISDSLSCHSILPTLRFHFISCSGAGQFHQPGEAVVLRKYAFKTSDSNSP
jgi:hypothetical protein